MDGLDKIIASVIAALFTALISLILFSLDRSKSISQSRKEWLELLRGDISKFLSYTTTIARLWETEIEKQREQYKNDTHHPMHNKDNLNEADILTFRNTHKELYVEAKLGFHGALLRLKIEEGTTPVDYTSKSGPEEKLCTALLKLHGVFYENDKNCGGCIDLAKNVREAARTVIKVEWERVKKGEPIYHIVNAVLVGVVLDILILFVWWWLYSMEYVHFYLLSI